MFCPNGVGGGPRGCLAVGLPDPGSFSLLEGFICTLSKSREVSGGGDSGTMVFMLFVGSGFGGASSELEESSSSRAGAGSWLGSGGRRDEESDAA